LFLLLIRTNLSDLVEPGESGTPARPLSLIAVAPCLAASLRVIPSLPTCLVVFADAFGGIARFRWQGKPFEAWLYTIARRRVADHLRVRGRAARHSSVEAPEAFRHGAEIVDHSAGIVEAQTMRALIARLPEGERDVIELRFMEDLDVDQAARRLGKNPGAVRVAQHRALTHLRRMMVEESR
jgi:RNA polymerase sigma factor (sigma-70 family)